MTHYLHWGAEMPKWSSTKVAALCGERVPARDIVDEETEATCVDCVDEAEEGYVLELTDRGPRRIR